MGVFIDPEELRSKLMIPELRAMSSPDLDELYICPAERMIDEHFRLDLNTDAIPEHLAWRFEQARHSTQLAKFQTDFKRAVVLLVNRMGSNPFGQQSQSVRGSSVVFGKRMPEEVVALMHRWGRPGLLYRV